MVFLWDFGHLRFWAKIKGGLRKKVKKTKQKTKKRTKSSKKERKEEKLKKMMQKDVQFAVCFQNRAISWCVGVFAPDIDGCG